MIFLEHYGFNHSWPTYMKSTSELSCTIRRPFSLPLLVWKAPSRRLQTLRNYLEDNAVYDHGWHALEGKVTFEPAGVHRAQAAKQ
eukprot:6470097-Amphidinium_carterae.1